MIIDFHYHYPDSPGAIEELLDDMDRSGVSYTLLTGGPPEAYWDYKKCRFASNEAIYQAVKKHPDRLIGNMYIDPRDKNAVKTVKQHVDKGFRAAKMIPTVGYFPYDDVFFPVYEAIEESGIPLLVHTGLTNVRVIRDDGKRAATDSRFSQPINLDYVCRCFPKMIIVMAHMGYPYFTEAWGMAHANENVWLDISGSGPWTDGIPLVYNALGGQNYIPIDFNRVVWGSDNCLSQAEHISRHSTYMRQIGATGEDRKKIFGENAARLLRL